MKKLKRFCLLLAFMLSSLAVSAQEGLNIDRIFNDYGRQKGSVLLVLAKDVLGEHSKISQYKSLIVASADSAMLSNTCAAIGSDLGADGTVMYSLRMGKSTTYEYALLSYKAKKMTLIYIKGDFPPDELNAELKKLKNLFIRVNNKQIKL
ncbi:hypothetical protein AGMMS49965_05810 [Bacteroidia bacterium]|nr:hypothetical protein AGMMS49965_05810 [Bacteroidia bacterium]